MKKIVGILSMQRVINYGSFLQAYALKQLLFQNGADEVYFIDIEKGRPLPGYEPSNNIFSKGWKFLSLLFCGKIISKIKDKLFQKRLTESIRAQFPLLELDKPLPEHFDVVFIGSDEVFHCCQTTSWGYTPQLYGLIPQADKVVSYAGSFGFSSYDKLLQAGVAEEIGKIMKDNLSSISVRDKNSYDIVKKLTDITPEINLDPVLIYGYKLEIDERKKVSENPYMIVYSYLGRISDKDEVNAIVSFAKSKSLKLISIFSRYDWCDEFIIPETPFDVLTWFKNAEFIVSDTFHGTIFSIITHQRFCALVRDSNESKLGYLLEDLSLENQLIIKERLPYIDSVLQQNINYEEVENKLNIKREQTQAYIKGVLF